MGDTAMTTRVLQALALGSGILLAAGCFGTTPEPTEQETDERESPAGQARAELRALRLQLKDAARAEQSALASAGAQLAAEDGATRVATALVLEMHRSVGTAPLKLDATLAASSPSLATRVHDLRAALQEHHGLLSDLSIVPLPPAPDAALLEGVPDPALVEAAVKVEEATGGRWPLKRVFVAYALELEAIRDEAATLATCTDACPAGVAEEAAKVQQEAERLAVLLEEFAALYC